MSKPTGVAAQDARQQRLAARLRENLHRRKAQARAAAAAGGADRAREDADDALPKGEGGG